jgi:hypothetical protein
MRSLISVLVLGVACVQLVPACKLGRDETEGMRADGTVDADTAFVQALVIGKVEGPAIDDLSIRVNGTPRRVHVGEDSRFVVRDVPEGRVTIASAGSGARGELLLETVHVGEVVDISVRRDERGLGMSVVRRTQALELRDVLQTDGPPLEIAMSNVCYWMKPGTYARDVLITGNDVRLLGSGTACDESAQTTLTGNLEIRGADVTVFDVEAQGSLTIDGARPHVVNSCSRCFNERCAPKGAHYAIPRRDAPHVQ